MKLRTPILTLLIGSLSLLAACGKSEDDSNSIQTKAEQAKEAVKEAASDTKQAAGEAMDKTGEMASDAKEATGEAMSDMGDAASEAMDKTGEMASDAKEATGEAMSDMGDTASEAMDKAGEKMDDTMAAAGSALAGGDAAKGKELSTECADCHGDNGMGDEETPKLAGLDEDYFIKQMQAYKAGTSKDGDDTMPMYAEALSDKNIADLAAYYASLPAK